MQVYFFYYHIAFGLSDEMLKYNFEFSVLAINESKLKNCGFNDFEISQDFIVLKYIWASKSISASLDRNEKKCFQNLLAINCQ